MRQQRRGKGSPTYKSPSHKHVAKIRYPFINSRVKARIIDIIDAPGRTAPLCVLDINGKKEYNISVEGMYVGQEIEFFGSGNKGDIIKVGDIPEGTKICNIEIHPNDGGKLCRSGGAFATIISHHGDKTIIQLPSKKMKIIPSSCKATVGVVAGSGRTEKPFLKAGKKFYAYKVKAGVYPRTSGVSMNPVDHPFGGSTHTGKHKTISRHMPPGKKVGSISAKRTGRRK